MSGRHREPQDAVCPWCRRRFRDRRAVETHALAKHRVNLPRTPEEEARAKLQAYHQDRVEAERTLPEGNPG